MSGTRSDPGVIVRAASYIFRFVRQACTDECQIPCVLTILQHSELDFLLRMTYAELYNEEVNDLFSDESCNLTVRERDGEFYVEGLTYRIARSERDIQRALADGDGMCLLLWCPLSFSLTDSLCAWFIGGTRSL